ncbi:MAG: MGMT family protein [Bacteroidales bacterium]|nr:MGMT family protein [Bacteroidales bacterium]
MTTNLNGLQVNGTSFQVAVWEAVSTIPCGETRTYKEIANEIGNPKAARAVANAVGKNPYPPQIPCHRVIRSNGKLGGYSGIGGIETKRNLLEKETGLIFKN